jgi:CHAT domain-containing protein
MGHETRHRLWWCPTGALSSLPLHAAGVYEGPSQDYVGLHVVSSYAPTLSALHRMLTEGLVKQDSKPMPASLPRTLLIAQPKISGHPLLPNATREAESVRALVPTGSLIDAPHTEGITVDLALEGVRTAHILHLACHGHQDQNNPLNSGFELENGRLTMGQLMRVNTPNAQLAYLSACESAGMDEGRPDEGLNLAGTMIFVGFKSVIATLW